MVSVAGSISTKASRNCTREALEMLEMLPILWTKKIWQHVPSGNLSHSELENGPVESSLIYPAIKWWFSIFTHWKLWFTIFFCMFPWHGDRPPWGRERPSRLEPKPKSAAKLGSSWGVTLQQTKKNAEKNVKNHGFFHKEHDLEVDFTLLRCSLGLSKSEVVLKGMIPIDILNFCITTANGPMSAISKDIRSRVMLHGFCKSKVESTRCNLGCLIHRWFPKLRCQMGFPSYPHYNTIFPR